VTGPQPPGPPGSPGDDAAAALARLGEEYFQAVHTIDPLNATALGVTGFDSLVADPSRAGAASGAGRIAAIERQVAGIDVNLLDETDATNHAVLTHLAWGARSELEHGLWEANASAGAYVAPAAMVFEFAPTALLRDEAAVAGYLTRLRGLPGFFDQVGRRYAAAARDGRVSTRAGLRQAIGQLEGHLAKDLAADTLAGVPLPGAADETAARADLARVVGEEVRPAMARLLAVLRDQLPRARPDERVGIRFVPGGAEGYRAAVRKHTTTGLAPEEIHQIGLDTLAALRDEWAELGGRALGTSDVPEILRRLREDPALRFTSSGQIVQTVTDALRRAEEARNDWFPAYDIADCVIEEIDPIEADNAPLAYYRPPAAGGLRPGAHCVLTARPRDRYVYEYEALSFHESTPGHHLQIASAQRLDGLPDFRRYLDAEVCGYCEGWGLYCERLADEMGLYTSGVQRLGMLSFDALRACRLVVDTGMHHFGWPRDRAIAFMWDNTATTRANVVNEIDRYIGWPGQALAYMIGRREIRRLREEATRALGARFDVRDFHGVVLGSGAVPLGVVGQRVTRWVERAAA
jgi:uncharacterized protein (DUF885 family)